MNPHDNNFKHNFLRPRVAKDFLRYNLPKEILHSVDIETLKIEPTEFLPSKYRSNRKADILYSVKNKAGKKIYAFLHLEGQSKHDKNMALRILEYHVAIAKAHLKQDNTKVPLILTFVLYHGKEKWSSPTSISELFEDFELYVKVSLKPNFLLNLTEREIEELKKQEASAAPQLLMKGQAQGEYCSLLADLLPLLKAYDQIDDENVDYMVSNDEHSEEKFFEEFRKFDPETANNYKKMFEVAIQRETKRIEREVQKNAREELKEATRKVKMQALIEGEEKGKLDIAKQMKAEGESNAKISKYTGLSIKEIEELA